MNTNCCRSSKATIFEYRKDGKREKERKEEEIHIKIDEEALQL